MYGASSGSVSAPQRNYAEGPKAVGGSLIGDATDRLSQAVLRAWSAVSAVRAFNDAIHGSQPSPPVTAGQGLDKSGTRGETLRVQLGALDAALDELASEVARLDRI